MKLSDLPERELPEVLRKLSAEKQQEYLDKKRAERDKIKTEIAKLNERRSRHLKEAAAEAGGESLQFDDAVLKAVREQARGRSFEYER